MKNKFSKAFSLVELSIVILVVGILLAAITKGKDLYSDMQLKTAQSVTSSSMINSMKSVSLWLDSTTIANIRDANGKPVDFGDNVHIWRDNKVSTRATAIELASDNSAGVSDSNRPVLIRNGFGGLPSIKFSGTNFFKLTNPAKSPLADNDDTYTVAVVLKSNHLVPASGTPIFIGDSSNHFAFNITDNANFEVSHSATNNKTGNTYIAHKSNAFIFVVNNNNTNNVKIYNNSNLPVEIATTTPASSSIVQNKLNIAANNDAPGYNGQISEVIVFNKEISQKEVEEINAYFKQKYGIPIRLN